MSARKGVQVTVPRSLLPTFAYRCWTAFCCRQTGVLLGPEGLGRDERGSRGPEEQGSPLAAYCGGGGWRWVEMCRLMLPRPADDFGVGGCVSERRADSYRFA
jgi:hypothetical protein